MMQLKVWCKVALILAAVVVISSCEEDFYTIGTELISQDIEVNVDSSRTVISYSRKLVPVQTNDMTAYRMGIYNDPVYGKSVSNFLGQITLNQQNPSFGDSAVVDSVFIYFPYFSQQLTNNEGEIEYTLDSVYGDTPYRLEIYESQFFLRDLDPDSNFEDPQNYYSNQAQTFEQFLGPQIGLVEQFVPSNEGFVINEGENNEERLGPGIRVLLDNEFFQEKIISKEGEPELLTNNNFKNYFRGIYLKAVETGNGDNYFIFNGAAPTVTMYYSFNSEGGIGDDGGSDDEDDDGRASSSLVFSFNAISVNTIDEEFPGDIQEAITNPNTTQGEETLYLRGGQGAMTIIELFGEDTDNNGVAEELEELRANEWLINDASLYMYIDQDKVTGGGAEPERIKLYDVENERLLIDYSFDLTAGNAAIDAITTHLGRIERGSDDSGEFYRLRITNHLSRLINEDSTNVALGLVVSQNVLLTDQQDLESTQGPGVNTIPQSSILSHEGTVLHGNLSPFENKRLKLKISYTLPN